MLMSLDQDGSESSDSSEGNDEAAPLHSVNVRNA